MHIVGQAVFKLIEIKLDNFILFANITDRPIFGAASTLES